MDLGLGLALDTGGMSRVLGWPDEDTEPLPAGRGVLQRAGHASEEQRHSTTPSKRRLASASQTSRSQRPSSRSQSPTHDSADLWLLVAPLDVGVGGVAASGPAPGGGMQRKGGSGWRWWHAGGMHAPHSSGDGGLHAHAHAHPSEASHHSGAGGDPTTQVPCAHDVMLPAEQGAIASAPAVRGMWQWDDRLGPKPATEAEMPWPQPRHGHASVFVPDPARPGDVQGGEMGGSEDGPEWREVQRGTGRLFVFGGSSQRCEPPGGAQLPEGMRFKYGGFHAATKPLKAVSGT